MARKLKYTELKNFDIEEIVNKFYDENYKEIENMDYLDNFQSRAIAALKLGLNIDSDGYNIYLAGDLGFGKLDVAKKYIHEIAKTKNTPEDLCYVYNFKNPKEPIFIKTKAGLGKELKKDIENLIEELLFEIPKTILGQDFEESKTSISKEYNKKREEIIKHISKEAKKHDFGVKTTGTGIYFMPIVDGIIITEEEYNNLEDDKKESIMEKSGNLQENVHQAMNLIREIDNLTKEETQDMEFLKILFLVGKITNKFIEKYIDNPKVLDYIKDLKEDILDNFGDFIPENYNEDELSSLIPWNSKKEIEDPLLKYGVNLFVDNSNTKGSPVILSHNLTYQSMFGEIEYDSEHGNLTTNFTKILSGFIHKANGGYLILEATDLNVFIMEGLFKFLKTKEVVIEPLKEFQSISINTINPEKIKNLNVKIILLGDFYLYDILSTQIDDFKKMFKIRADFDYEINANTQNIYSVLKYIENFSKKKDVFFEKDAKVLIINYVIKLSGRKDKLTTNLMLIDELLEESFSFAKIENNDKIHEIHVKKAIEYRYYINSLYEEKLTSHIDENIIMIDTTGEKIGQINGLAVIDLDEYAFGKPVKITATSYAGKSGVINIEKESKLSGKVHDKGVHIISGYLGNMYAKKYPLSISVRISFEQSYSGIDGDSASSTELFAIISSISKIPLSQEIAVTGSMNQFGEIQAIGGVTEKIEGFFDICKKRNLTGKQGVIIPLQNMVDLVLKDEVIEAVKNSEFHIYAISTVDEGLEILTDFTAIDIHNKVQERLDFYSNLEKRDTFL
ncbi:MAG: AAA family ATPase [Defluviitaleaceae bacterium]|nr:AAA family ATPase [Defluviitaleaceae bacterium]